MRVSRDGGKSYPLRLERELTAELPTLPAAPRIFGKDGTCRALFFDFDSSIDGIDRVDADVRRLTSWLYSHGARWIVDRSPNGGCHVYVPLAERVPFHEAREVVEALGTRYRSLDKTPHQNIAGGCMRTPGSPHKRGGHQRLEMSLSMAYDIARRPNSATIWLKLRDDLRDEIAAVRSLRLEQDFASGTEPDGSEAAAPVRGMSRAMVNAATTGDYDSSRYNSPSEARQAVLLSAAAAGLSLTDVERRMKQGTWPGLAQFYARYRAPHRYRALRRDWRRAESYLASRPARKNHDRISPTSGPTTQRGVLQGQNLRGAQNEHRFIRTWRNALVLAEGRYRTREGMARRMILRALGAASHMTGSRYVEFGVRSLAIASGIDHTTVASHLKSLRTEPDPLIVLVESGRGTHGDLYTLSIPESLTEAAAEVSWRRGKLHALRPVFRELGLPAAFVYEALEHSPTVLSTTQLVSATGMSRTAVSEALQILASWNLVARGSQGAWSIARSTSLSLLAEQFGVLDSVAAQVLKYRAEREAWRQWLAGHLVSAQQQLLAPGEDYPWESFAETLDEWALADAAFAMRRP